MGKVKLTRKSKTINEHQRPSIPCIDNSRLRSKPIKLILLILCSCTRRSQEKRSFLAAGDPVENCAVPPPLPLALACGSLRGSIVRILLPGPAVQFFISLIHAPADPRTGLPITVRTEFGFRCGETVAWFMANADVMLNSIMLPARPQAPC